MWFKQIQLFQLIERLNSSSNALAEKLEPYAFKPCLPSMPNSIGWVSPIDEPEAPLTRGLNGCMMICLQIEEKILPSSVISQSLKDKIKQIEVNEGRKIRQKEKLSFKDEITHTLLQRAFSKFTRLYAYVDTRNNWLILNTSNAKKAETFISLLKKSLGDIIEPVEVIKPSTIVTQWLKTQTYPQSYSIEKACVLQDPNKQNRVIRCQQQDLFVSSIQSLVNDGCEAIQIALCWQDRLAFVLAEDFSLRAIHLADEDIVDIKEEIESKLQKFDADFIMMIEMFSGLIQDLLETFAKQQTKNNLTKVA